MNIDPLIFGNIPTGKLVSAPLREAATGVSFLAEVQQGFLTGELQEPSPVQPQGLEERLKARYPGLAYHVFDGSSRYWRYRQDYPFHKLYQQDIDPAEIENWRPSGPNPDPLSSQVQRNLGSIPPGSRAVIIHPAVQKRMEEDPAYADEIYSRIEAWFTFDVVRNEAILPGCTTGMSQCVAIGEDGQIANVESCSSSGIGQSKSGDDTEEDFWDARAKRHRAYMRQVVEAQILHSLGLTGQLAALRRAREQGADSAAGSAGSGSGAARQMAALQASQLAIAQTMEMMNGTQLREALGETVAGVSIDVVFRCTKDSIAKFHPTAVL